MLKNLINSSYMYRKLYNYVNIIYFFWQGIHRETNPLRMLEKKED